MIPMNAAYVSPIFIHPSINNFAAGARVRAWIALLLLASMVMPVHEALAGTVTTTADGGAGSLRQTIINAVANETITFAGGVTGTITLTSGELVIDKT